MSEIKIVKFLNLFNTECYNQTLYSSTKYFIISFFDGISYSFISIPLFSKLIIYMPSIATPMSISILYFTFFNNGTSEISPKQNKYPHNTRRHSELS